MIRLENILKTSWKCLEDIFQDVLKTSKQDVLKMSRRRLEDVLKMSWCLDSPHKLLSRRQPRYSTHLYCLMEWSWKQIFKFASVLFLVKRFALVLSSPKWIDNLLSMDHSQRDVNSLFKTLSIFCISLCW